MAEGYPRRPWGNGPRRPRSRLTGCLLWFLGLIIVLVILSLLFGGFQKGTKVGGAGHPVPVPARAVRLLP
jgi:hypothetical protein